MYNLPQHKEKNEAVVNDFIARYPFAFVSGCDAQGKPVATQIPVFIEEQNGRKILRGHIMKHTDHHRAFEHNQHVLVIFTGHNTYVSGSWYSNPYTPSTWNYMSVHVQGIIRFLDDAALIDALRKITLHFENGNTASTTIYDNLPTDYTQRLMQAIVAFEIEIKEINTVFKLSQDRDEKSYERIIKELMQQGESGQVIAAEMQKRQQAVFTKSTT